MSEAATPHALVVRGAEAVVVDGATSRTGDLVVIDGTVVDALPAGVAADIIDAAGCIVTPGLVNAHAHLLQTAFRTLPGTRGVPMREWLQLMNAAYAAAAVDAELAGLAARAGAAEAALYGVTTIADHQLHWPKDASSVAIAKAVVDGTAGVGIRLVHVRGSAADDPETAAASAEDIVNALLPGTSTGISADGTLQLGVGPAGVHSDSPETFRLFGEVAARYGLVRRTQANEVVDVDIARERYGRRPLDLLEDWGWLAPDVTIAHLCAITDDELARVAASGAAATHAPGCDVVMGWGVAPAGALHNAGVRVGLGTSGGGSNDAGHLLADARLAMQVSPLSGHALTAEDVLTMATAGSADGLGRPELGRLTPGSAADFCVWDVSGVADAGVGDVVAGLLWTSPGRRPRDVYVAGREVVADGVLVQDSEREIAADLHRRVGR
ncbi:amidohydrolase family protein [Microbacterium sediminicola]|uniref:Amidohydrolase family protein n=1 Tax=Microbacterium sediminicola TaxID=415210 RepID=A0ABN2IKG4_9MICO